MLAPAFLWTLEKHHSGKPYDTTQGLGNANLKLQKNASQSLNQSNPAKAADLFSVSWGRETTLFIDFSNN